MKLNEFLNELNGELNEAEDDTEIEPEKKLPEPMLSKVKSMVRKKMGSTFKDLKTSWKVSYWYEPGDDTVSIDAEPKNYQPDKFPDMWSDIETSIDDDELRGTWIEVELDDEGNPESVELMYDESSE